MNDAMILAAITQVARQHVAWHGPVHPDMRLAEDLALDSLKLLTLAVEIENHFRICLDPDEDQELETVGDLVLEIRRKLP